MKGSFQNEVRFFFISDAKCSQWNNVHTILTLIGICRETTRSLCCISLSMLLGLYALFFISGVIKANAEFIKVTLTNSSKSV